MRRGDPGKYCSVTCRMNDPELQSAAYTEPAR
jgi:hypothetical protein